MTIRILTGNCHDVMATMEPESVDACVTDPPYHLTSIVKRFGSDTAAPAKSNGATGVYARASAGFMGQTWDGGDVAFRPETWAAVFRVLKPGAWLLAFGGTRTQHRMVCAIEDAGFEIRDQIGWAYGSGFPKSLDVSKAIDKAAGAEREVVGFDADKFRPNRVNRGLINSAGSGGFQADNGATITAPATPAAAAWQGWGTAIKPAWEPICVARKPLVGTVAANVLAHGTGALNIDGCRIDGEPWKAHRATGLASEKFFTKGAAPEIDKEPHILGRWPANLVHDGSDEVLACFPTEAGGGFGKRGAGGQNGILSPIGGTMQTVGFGDTGSAARFFYTAKSSRSERGDGCTHPTVKPISLMRWLIRLVTPPGGTVLDPFAGSGTTGIAANIEQMNATLIEMSPEYAAMAATRIRAEGGLFAEVAAE